ncbi:ATP synthase mitochondrial F1 complex assembly factor 1-like [Clavelina lepadiformis]|uniref:ATP synthase mitochondrial F1 complex assembly factor 1-like n=1 Tax=Clavelina lepadiformis TaxID=159417 RepID=UPI004040ECA0
MSCSGSLVKEYTVNILYASNKGQMNSPQAYVRLFPMLLGTPYSRYKLAASFATQINGDLCSSNSHASLSGKQLENNPYFKKYADKINKIRLTDPAEYKRRLKVLEDMNSSKKNDNEIEQAKVKDQKAIPASDTQHQNQQDIPNLEIKGLDSILKLDKIRTLPVEEITNLWVQHYASKDAVCAVIKPDAYKTIKTIGSVWPVFVYPLPRQDGFEMFVGQFASDEFHFTSLINYQRHRDNAPSQLTLKHYTELENDKGIILMSGMVLDEALSVVDAQLLAYQVQYFTKKHPDLIKKFNNSPQTFDVNEIIDTLDSSLLSKASFTEE